LYEPTISAGGIHRPVVALYIDHRKLVVHLARQVLDPDPRPGCAQ
jgi:hypothetical protein